MSLPVLAARADFIAHARPSVSYCEAVGIDWVATEPHCGGVFIAPIKVVAPGRFEFCEDGREAAVIEAIEADGETVADLVSWRVDEPDQILTACGRAAVLGEAVAASAATYFGGRPLRLFRTPLAWLRSGGCDGVALLDLPRAARWLNDTPGKLLAEDRVHAGEIRKAMLGAIDVGRILVPSQEKAAA